jgi:hypothetical protein
MRAFLLALCLLLPLVARAHADWYVSRWNRDTCVPVSDVLANFAGPRVYDGSGPYATPDDILSALEGDGDAVTRIVGVGPGSEGFLIEGHGQAIVSLFFSGLPACQTAMSGAVP